MKLIDYIAGAGFQHPEWVIHTFVGGSALHGAKVRDTDDLDIYGVFIEPPELIIGLDRVEHFCWSTAGNDRRNGPDDVDVTLYSLRKWAGLAAKGNPTALHFLYALNQQDQLQPWNTDILPYRKLFLASDHYKQFTGFADAQLKRMTGERGRGKKGQRPELEQKFGYDVKAAMHVIRLLHEAIELLKTGTIIFPRPEKDLLIEIRTGQWSMERVLNLANQLFPEVKTAAEKSPLPKTVDRAVLSDLLSSVYRRQWEKL